MHKAEKRPSDTHHTQSGPGIEAEGDPSLAVIQPVQSFKMATTTLKRLKMVPAAPESPKKRI